MAKETNDTNVTESSGNVFADLRFPNADRKQLEAKLKLEIYLAIKDRGFTQTQAGEILGIQQPHVSVLMSGRSGNYSLGWRAVRWEKGKRVIKPGTSAAWPIFSPALTVSPNRSRVCRADCRMRCGNWEAVHIKL